MTTVADDKHKTQTLSERMRVTDTRNLLAQGVSLVAGLCAAILVGGALMVALGANADNDLVQFVRSTAASVDFGVFDRGDGVFTFEGKNRQTKNALVNWGLAAVAWLVIGRVVSGIIRK